MPAVRQIDRSRLSAARATSWPASWRGFGCSWARAPWTSSGMCWISVRSEEHTSELQSLMRISYAVFCLKKKTHDSQILQRYNIHHTNNEISKHTHTIYI